MVYFQLYEFCEGVSLLNSTLKGQPCLAVKGFM